MPSRLSKRTPLVGTLLGSELRALDLLLTPGVTLASLRSLPSCCPSNGLLFVFLDAAFWCALPPLSSLVQKFLKGHISGVSFLVWPRSQQIFVRSLLALGFLEQTYSYLTQAEQHPHEDG